MQGHVVCNISNIVKRLLSVAAVRIKVDALVYYIDPDNEEMKIAYPTLLFDRNIIDGRAMMCSVLTLTIGNNQGMGDVEYGKIYDIYFPPAYLRLFDGPSCSVVDMWRILGRGTTNGGLVVGTIIKPKLGLQPKPFGEACYAFWQGGDGAPGGSHRAFVGLSVHH